MQSYLSIGMTAFLTLEIGFFLLCSVSQFKRINSSVIISAVINLTLLFLVQQFFQKGDLFSDKVHLALLGFIPFLILSLLIFSLDMQIQSSQKNLALKLPFLGLALGYYVPLPYFFIVMAGSFILLTYFLWKNIGRYRLYFRANLFMLFFIFICLVNLLFFNVSLINFISVFFIIFYLNQLLNLMMVKNLLRLKLGEPQ
jgi:hypothetical protein